jgi:hypothetical protein
MKNEEELRLELIRVRQELPTDAMKYIVLDGKGKGNDRRDDRRTTGGTTGGRQGWYFPPSHLPRYQMY